MKISELFLKPVDRPIEGVIKADDLRNLQTELEEYVVTRDVAKGLGTFCERYLHELTANGVWISGFFGSGKSHLLKILSLVLSSEPLANGMRPADFVLPKIEDEILRGDMRLAASIPSRSVLFNIDQKFDGVGGDHTAPILEVFVKVFNELRGYYGQQGYIARFEYELDKRGQFQPFQETYLRVNRSPWSTDREAISTVRKAAFGNAYAEHFGVSEADAYNVMKQAKDEYRVSIESFAQTVKEYIDHQAPGFRLNFFVDEVGQFIGQNSKLMLNLQTVVETLATVCDGRAWVFVTSQADLQGVLGDLRGAEGQDLSKITGRFKTRLTLASADVREVIQRRLLAKTEDEPEALTAIYDREKDNLQTLFRFGDNSRNMGGWRGSAEFCGLYPFHPYQFELFQTAIQQLSTHNVFTGKFLSVGERSMLAVFQEVAMEVRDLEVGRLATFDMQYDGLAASIRGDMQTPLKLAERQLGKGLELRILKSLFLLKWVREFKATPRNVAILLIDDCNPDIAAHEKAVRTALETLEAQSYLQRTGDVFEFLTEIEKDIETEIKNQDIDDAQVTDQLVKILFQDVLRDAKIRYEGNAQDYPYARKIDDQLVGRDADVTLNLITTDNPNHGNEQTLAMQSTGKTELLAVLPADTRLIEQARLFLKTQKFVQQNSGDGDETRRAVLEVRAQQNSQRGNLMREIAADLLSRAPLYLNGSRLESVGQGEARNRFARAFQELVTYSYPSLRMMRGNFDESTLSKALLEKDDLLSGGLLAPSEAESEVLTYVTRNQNSGERTSVEEIIRNFNKRPYGWSEMATLTTVSRLYRMGKVELRDGELLDGRGAFERLRNSRQRGAVRVRLQEHIDAAQVEALKKFHHDFFARPNSGVEARSVGDETVKAFAVEVQELTMLLDQSGRYRFLGALKPVVDRLKALSDKDYTYLMKHQAEFEDELLTAKDDLLSPIKAFMHGAQRAAYDEAIAFLREEEANFAEIPAEEVQPLIALAASAHPYRGQVVPAAKAAVTSLRASLAGKLDMERSQALEALASMETRLREVPDFQILDEPDQQRVLAPMAAARRDIEVERFAPRVRDRLARYTTSEYPAQLTMALRLATPVLPPPIEGEPEPQPVAYTPATALRPQCDLPYIATPADLDQWLDALRTAAQAELDKGNRISL